MKEKNKNLKNQEEFLKEENSTSRGELLKSARLKKGLSLELVHEETKIPLDALRAIEEGYTIRTLSNFYYNGFLKIYAKYLGVDVNKVVAPAAPTNIAPLVEDAAPSFDFDEWAKRVFNRKTKQQIVVVVGMLLSFFVLFKVFSFVASQVKNRKKSAPVSNTKTQPKEVSATTVTDPKKTAPQDTKKTETLSSLSQSKGKEEAPAVIPTPAQTPEKTQARPDPVKPDASKPKTTPEPSSKQGQKVTLTVRATKNSWLRVEVDGQVEFQSTLKLGSVETWFADKEIIISGRNISYLEFELNGKMIGKLGRKDRKVNEVTITEDGLQVTK